MEGCRGLYRRDGKLVYIKQPEFSELDYIRELWSDYETMKDVGGTFEFSREKWELFYKKMIFPTDGKNFYCLIYDTQDNPVGEVSFHGYDSATKIARFNVKIQHRFRNKGYGSEATRLMLEYYFNEFGGQVMMDTVGNDNGQNAIAKIGFEAIRKHGSEITYRLTKENFFSIHRAGKRRVGILLYEGCNLLSVTTVYEIFSLAQRVKEDCIEVFTLGEKRGVIKTSVGMELKVDCKFDEVDGLEILVLPNTNNVEEVLRNENIMKFTKKYFDGVEIVLGICTGSLLLAKAGLLEGLTVNIKGVYKEEMKCLTSRINWSSNAIVDNGRFILCNNVYDTMDASLYVIKKLLGEENCKSVLEILEGEN